MSDLFVQHALLRLHETRNDRVDHPFAGEPKEVLYLAKPEVGQPFLFLVIVSKFEGGGQAAPCNTSLVTSVKADGPRTHFRTLNSTYTLERDPGDSPPIN